ncbi:conserved exported hypothetical protein [Candidatus Methylobacter favarea]|uniref:DUF4124 domain-containing protein n=1 Tax=Candidatus Methylobacter favarea TaxID=2707345 RepID=A0A8S0Y636_9GAMM|nr:DUF4124 domain-containing protein [Candidatus Methylobacter favarea]CAA9890400.1 conserved exported hypothetical protein [Candidatus Methylobacter favarea]
MRLILLILGSLFSACSYAGVYKCTAVNGATAYRSKPCAAGQSNIKINIRTGSSTNLDDQKNHQALAQQEQQAMLEQQKLAQEKLLQQEAQLRQKAINESAKNQFLIKNNPEKFSAFAIPPYAPEQLPALVSKYQTRLADIERLRRYAAEKALATSQCSRVEAAELNIKSTREALVFLVDCSSAKHFYFTEQELVR